MWVRRLPCANFMVTMEASAFKCRNNEAARPDDADSELVSGFTGFALVKRGQDKMKPRWRTYS